MESEDPQKIYSGSRSGHVDGYMAQYVSRDINLLIPEIIKLAFRSAEQ